MEINIKVSDEQIKKLKDFGLGNILDDVIKDMERFGGFERPFRRSMLPFTFKRSKLIPERTSEDKKPLTYEEIKFIEDKIGWDVRGDVKELFRTKKREELLKIVLERLDTNSLALLIRK